MIKKSLLIWVIILTFGIASMPALGFSTESKQTGNTESSSKKPKKKHSKKSSKKSKKNSKKNSKKTSKTSKKHKKGSKKYKSGGKKKYSKRNSKGKKHSKNVKYSKKSKGKKHSKYSKGKKHSKKRGSMRNRTSYVRKHYTPPTNSNNVEYRNYKRSDNDKESIEKIAPQKEIRKEPKKEGEN